MADKVSQAEAGAVLGVSPQTIGRMEEGRPTNVSDLYMNTLCGFYGASDEDRAAVLTYAAEVRVAQKTGGGWWRAYMDAITPGFDHYIGLEESARKLTAWQLTLLPGLLQTVEYRRAMIWAESPSMSPDDVQQRIDLASRRQSKLFEDGFQMEVYLSEAVLHYAVGSGAVMAEQLRHLADAAQLQNVDVRVVPFSAGAHVGLSTNRFVLLEFGVLPTSKLIEPPIVYLEEHVGGLYLEREDEIREYRQTITNMQRVALNQRDTRELVLKTAEEFASER